MLRFSRPLAPALLTLALAAGAAAPSARAAGVEWQPLSLDQAITAAKTQGRKVMIDVYSEQCGDCRRMDSEVWTSDSTAAFAATLVPIRINSATPEGSTLMSRYPITGLPTIMFLNSSGTEIDRIVGFEDAVTFLHDARPMAGGVDPLAAME